MRGNPVWTAKGPWGKPVEKQIITLNLKATPKQKQINNTSYNVGKHTFMTSCSSYDTSREVPLLIEASRDDPSSSLKTSNPRKQ